MNAAVQWAKIIAPRASARCSSAATSGEGAQEVALGSDADQVGVLGRVEAVLDVDVEARRPAHAARARAW